MRAWRRFSMLAATGFAAACSPVLVNVPVTGPAPAIRQLEGEWVGEYSGGPAGREGGLVFKLVTGKKVASGDVWMNPRVAGVAACAGSAPTMTPAAPPLFIRFVWIEENVVTGTLDLYRDSETDNILMTTFRGRVNGDDIKGTFVTENKTTGQMSSGNWSAKRVANATPAAH